MSVAELRNLHRLHIIDTAIVEIRKRAAALDPGNEIKAKMAVLQGELDTDGGHARALHSEQTDLELQQKAIDTKVAQIDKDLYSGKIVNPREVEAFQKEIQILKRRRSDMDDRLLELMEIAPVAKEKADAIQAKIDVLQGDLVLFQKKVIVLRAELEKQYKEVVAKRATAAALVPPAMLARYEAIRQKTGGIGMADIDKRGYCEMCGTHLPEKLIEGAKDGRIQTCESCHRILYASDGLV
jgi:uncharacterized protein